MRKNLFALLLLPIFAFGQGGTSTQIRAGSSLPTACGVAYGGTIFYKTTSPIGHYECSVAGNPGTWRQIYNSGTGGTVTHTAGALTLNALICGNGSADINICDLTGDVTTSGSKATTIASNAVTAAKSAVVLTRRQCVIQTGDGSTTAVSGDYSPFKQPRCKVPYAATIVEVDIQTDAGTPSILLQRRRGASTVADLLSGALAANGTTWTCALASTSGTCIDGTTSSGSITLSNTSLDAGDVIEVKSGTASTEKSATIAITWTVN